MEQGKGKKRLSVSLVRLRAPFPGKVRSHRLKTRLVKSPLHCSPWQSFTGVTGSSAGSDMLQGKEKVVSLFLNALIVPVKIKAPAKSFSREKAKKGFKPIFTACAH